MHPESQSRSLEMERRSVARRRTLLTGQAILNGHFSTIDVTIRNLSDHGALVVFDAVTPLPERFELGCKLFRRPVRRIWQKERQVGVAFD